jgi:mRNA-degrading endonuclease RelE of RelBE toxin-antitoxin system
VSFEVVPLKPFERQLKRLVAKYPSLKKKITELVHTLELDPNHGTSIGKGCWKIRISIASKGGGKSGGSRVITHVRVTSERVYLLSIYDKSEQDTLTDKELKAMLALIPA